MVVFLAYHFPHSSIVVPLDAEDEKMHDLSHNGAFLIFTLGMYFLETLQKQIEYFIQSLHISLYLRMMGKIHSSGMM